MDKRSTFDKALNLGKFWHQENGNIPENLGERIQFALNLAKKDISEAGRKTISEVIRALGGTCLPEIKSDEKTASVLSDFEKGEKSLADVFDRELEIVDETDPADELKQKIGDVNSLVYKVLKGILDGELRSDALTSLDLVIDKTRNNDFKNSINTVLAQIEENLKDLPEFKEVRLTHVNPDPEAIEYSVHTTSQEASEPQEHTNINSFEWQKYGKDKINVQYSSIQIEEANETRLVFKLSFGEAEFGYLEYRFEGDKIHPIVFGQCANMSAMVDTFLNSRLQDEVKNIIAQKKREILAEHSFSDWPIMCTELCKLLSKFLKQKIAFSCDYKPGESKSWDVLIDSDKIEEDADFIRFTKESLDRGGEFFDIEIDSGTKRQRIGSLMVACKDDAQRGIVNDALSFLEGIILGRENARLWGSKLIGAPTMDKWLKGDIEKVPTPHSVVVLYSDIDDYSKTVREFAAMNPSAAGGIDKIMTRFLAQTKLIIEKKYNVVIDKFVGDEVIVLVGPPYDKEGVDSFGNKEPDFAHDMDLAFDIANELQTILDKASKEVQYENGFKLPRRLTFANGCGIVSGDPVGLYGDLEEPGAGVDYTIFGNEMNRVARVLGKADGGQFLTTQASYLQYMEKGGTKLKPAGETFEVETHGVGKFKVIPLKEA